MKKYPIEDDFEVLRVDRATVEVLFRPTQSYYTFSRVEDGDLSPAPPTARHAGPTNDTGDYWSYEVADKARDFAFKAVGSRKTT
jgi:hypothetical protein